MKAAEWIAKRREIEQAATAQPWDYGTPDDGNTQSRAEWMATCAASPDMPAANALWVVWIEGPIIPAITGDGPTSEQNAAFIADARTSFPRALDALEKVLEKVQPHRRIVMPGGSVDEHDYVGELADDIEQLITEALGVES